MRSLVRLIICLHATNTFTDTVRAKRNFGFIVFFLAAGWRGGGGGVWFVLEGGGNIQYCKKIQRNAMQCYTDIISLIEHVEPYELLERVE